MNLVISLAFRPLAAALSDRQGQYAHAYGICAPFYCISIKNYMEGGYNASMDIITRDIAKFIRGYFYY